MRKGVGIRSIQILAGISPDLLFIRLSSAHGQSLTIVNVYNAPGAEQLVDWLDLLPLTLLSQIDKVLEIIKDF